MRDHSAETLFQSFLQEAVVGSSGMGRNVMDTVALKVFLLVCAKRIKLAGDHVYKLQAQFLKELALFKKCFA